MDLLKRKIEQDLIKCKNTELNQPSTKQSTGLFLPNSYFALARRIWRSLPQVQVLYILINKKRYLSSGISFFGRGDTELNQPSTKQSTGLFLPNSHFAFARRIRRSLPQVQVLFILINKKEIPFIWYLFFMVEVTRLELAASASRTQRSTKLSYTSKY